MERNCCEGTGSSQDINSFDFQANWTSIQLMKSDHKIVNFKRTV